MKKRNNKIKRVTGAIFTAVIIAAIVAFSAFCYNRTGTFIPTEELFDGRPTFRFLDVGQGDSTLVTFGGDSVLVDAGPTSSGATAAEYIWLYSPCVDYFIITHPHEDHMGGAVDILERVNVEYLVMSDAVSDETFYNETVRYAERRGVEIIYLEGAATYTVGGITVEIADNSDLQAENGNDESLFVRITAGGTSCLITGDAEQAAEEYALAHYGDVFLDCDIMKAGHHGSASSNSEALLRAVSPHVVVIQCGRNNSYGHPSGSVLERFEALGITVYRTDIDGDVVIRGTK